MIGSKHLSYLRRQVEAHETLNIPIPEGLQRALKSAESYNKGSNVTVFRDITITNTDSRHAIYTS